jgi:hypothetical protein|tara:strand:- start:148 stop:1176 length:1029 start_codon:yes stop_codon:yes gene_type:complete
MDEIVKFVLPNPDTGSMLALSDVEPPTALIPGIAYRTATTLFCGQAKAGKSTLLRDLLQRIHSCHTSYQTVKSVVPHGNVRAANVLIISEEAGWAWAEFAEGLPGNAKEKDWLRVIHRGHGRISPGGREELRPWVDAVIERVKVHDIDIVILDPVTRILALESENENSEVLRALMEVERIATEGNCSVIMVHHSSKSGATARGAGAWEQQPDIILTLRALTEKEEVQNEDAVPKERIRVMEGRGRFPGIVDRAVLHMDEDRRYHYLEGAIMSGRTTADFDGERILQLMLKNPAMEYRAGDLSAVLDMDIQRFRRAMRSLCERNRVEKHGATKNATYTLAEEA